MVSTLEGVEFVNSAKLWKQLAPGILTQSKTRCFNRPGVVNHACPEGLVASAIPLLHQETGELHRLTGGVTPRPQRRFQLGSSCRRASARGAGRNMPSEEIIEIMLLSFSANLLVQDMLSRRLGCQHGDFQE